MRQIYLDHAATTSTDPRVVEVMLPYFSNIYGNPSSLHAFGQEARRAVEEARDGIATFLGAKPEEIVFTSGGTESNNFAIKGVALTRKGKGNHIITSAIEHHAVLEPSHVLTATGLPHELAHGSLRFSLGKATTEEEMNDVIKVLPGIVKKLRSISPLYKKEAM